MFAAADDAPSYIIPHDYTQMLMDANSYKCLKVCVLQVASK